MKRLVTIFFTFHFCLLTLYGQDLPTSAEQQLENLTDSDQAETEDDSYLQQLEYFKTNPVNLNIADEQELRELRILSDLQIANLLSYRRVFGKLIHIYELQAVPTWDIPSIRKLLPFISLESPVSIKDDIGHWLKGGDHSLLLRYGQVLEKQKGFDNSADGTKYLGGSQRLFFRYRYRYKNLLQFGLVGDKDAGEQFFKGAQSMGFDFYSFHLFAKGIGMVQVLALGDFTVNMGQGLIQWQSLAFKKSADVMSVKRQSATLRPYNSAGEFNFNRGIGITARRKNTEITVFGSWRKITANFDSDTAVGDHISSFLMSGYHRTASEIANRNKLRQLSFGATARYFGSRWQLAVNGIYYNFSTPVQKRDEPYNLFAWHGKSWYNISIDYSYTYKNLHFFGETATDKNFNRALLNGLLVSVDQRVDVSVVLRSIAKEYQAVNANAFTENTYPTNENGIYAGITLRPATPWRIDLYSDLYQFPWLKYRVDAPSRGKDFLVQLTYTPNRQTEIYTRFRSESKHINHPATHAVTKILAEAPKQSWRVHAGYKINTSFTLRSRAEMSWFNKKTGLAEAGFLALADILYKPLMKPYSGIVRLAYFETDGYNSRIYAYENDVLYSYSIPVFSGKGCRYYLSLNYDVGKRLGLWLRWAQTIYRDTEVIGSGPDEIEGSRRTELKLQVRYLL